MNLPQIDLASLPDLHQLVGVFGSLVDATRIQSDDRLVVIMTWLYEILP